MISNNVTAELKHTVANFNINKLTQILDRQVSHEGFLRDRQVKDLFECAKQAKNTQAMAIILERLCNLMSGNIA